MGPGSWQESWNTRTDTRLSEVENDYKRLLEENSELLKMIKNLQDRLTILEKKVQVLQEKCM